MRTQPPCWCFSTPGLWVTDGKSGRTRQRGVKRTKDCKILCVRCIHKLRKKKSGRVINLASIPALTLGLFRWPSPSASVQKVPVDSQEGGGGGPSWLYDFLVSAGKLTHWCDISSEAWPKSRRQRELWCWTTYVTGSELWKLLPGVRTFAPDKQKYAHEKVPYWNHSLRSVVVFFQSSTQVAYHSITINWLLNTWIFSHLFTASWKKSSLRF